MIFNKTNIQKLQARKSRYVVMDDSIKFFGIKVYPNGRKAFIVRMPFNGKRIEYKIDDCIIGDAGEAEEARSKAKDVIKQYQAGIDAKQAEHSKKLQNITLEQCIDEYLPTVKRGTYKSVNEARLIWDKAGWLNKPLKDITQLMVLKLYDKRVKVSFHGARQEASYLRAIWNSNKKALSLGESPTIILNEERKGWNKRTVNNRRLDFETASKWYQALNALPARDKNLFLLIYYSGVRVSEAMNLTWDNIDFDNKSLYLPDTKNGQPLEIPLNTFSIEILNSILAGDHHHQYVFPQVNKAGEVEAMKYYSKSLGKLKKQGINWSPHDSRRGFITCADVIGVSHYTAKQLTNHVIDNDIHGGYIHYTIAEMREPSQRIGDALHKQLKADNIIQFKKRA